MNQINKTILREEIKWLLETINEQFEALNSYESKIPQIEFDIIMGNIRKLYEDLYFLNRTDGSNVQAHALRQEAPAVNPHVSLKFVREKEGEIAEQPAVKQPVKIRVETEIPESREKEVHREVNVTGEPDLFSSESAEFSGKLMDAREKNFASDRLSSKPKDLKSSISINEKFLFINELFDGNLREYNITIETLNGFADLRQAMEFLDLMRVKNLWESESLAFKRLREMVDQKF